MFYNILHNQYGIVIIFLTLTSDIEVRKKIIIFAQFVLGRLYVRNVYILVVYQPRYIII